MQRTFLLIGLIILVIFSTHAQNNIIKTDLSRIPLGRFSLAYERVLNQNHSVSLEISRSTNSTFKNSIDILLNQFGLDMVDLGIYGSGQSFTLDYRFYQSKNDLPRGFYFAPYLYYSNYGMGGIGLIDHDDVAIISDFNTFGAGLKLGVHWIIKDRFSIDWYILGLGAHYLNAEIDLISADPQVNYAEVKNEFDNIMEDLPYIGSRTESEITDMMLKGTSNFLFPGFKAGFSIGYAF